jgi:two-component system NtrC family sensor kinase
MSLVNDSAQPADATLRAALVRTGKPAAIGQLTAGVAHEINNPLFAILGLVELLLTEVESGTKAHARLTLVHETALEIKETVRALVEFAREPAEGRQLVELGEVVAQTLHLVRRTTSAKDVEIVDRIGGEPAPVHATPNQLKQILVSLLTNAIQALPGGGTVTVALERDGDCAVVTVTDTGSGIAPEARQHVFEPFFTTRREKGAAGLGLAISRAIAEAHGGTLDLRSAPAAGATFALRLPLASEEPSA